MLLGLGALFAFFVSLALSALLSWSGPVDRPRDRGMHRAPTPTSGGLAIITGTAIGFYYLAFQYKFASWGFAVSLALGVLLGLVGALDDLFDLPAKAKLGMQIVLALAFAALAPHLDAVAISDSLIFHLPVWLAIPGVALWIVVVINAVNFMDGSNGLVAGSMAIVLLIYAAILGQYEVIAGAGVVVVAGAALGFLPVNFPKARLFQGDAGALFLGGIAAAIWVVIQGGDAGRPNLLAGPIALLPFLTDVFMTLISRARRRAALLDAHREHLYQRWLAQCGGDHPALAWRMWAIMAGYGSAALFAGRCSAALASIFFISATLVAVSGWLWIDRQVRRANT